jgi:hypothetical protein
MKPTAIALAAGLALVAAAIAVTLSGAPVAVVGANSSSPIGTFAETTNRAGACQGGEVLPAGVTSIRLTLASAAGPWVRVHVLQGSRVLTGGIAGNGWLAGAVTVPVRALAHPVSQARICFTLGPTVESVGIVGEPTNPDVAARSRAGKALPGRFRVEYLRAGSSSWWSQALKVARRIGLGRSPAGTWVVLALIALMVAVVAVASRLALRELG